MKEIIEEYGEVLLAIVGAVGVIGLSTAMFWNEVAQQVVLIAKAY